MIEKLNFDEKGFIPAVIQDSRTGKVLTLCYMDRVALEKTVEEGKVHVFRRSKNRVMLKGEISGNVQLVNEIFVDCTDNSILIKVEQKVAACHKGYFTCYFRKIEKDGSEKITEKIIFDPQKIYKK